MAELKPCPFCGSKAKTMVTNAASYAPDAYKVNAHCTGVGCMASIDFMYYPAPWIKNPERQAKTVIAKAWNRRAGNET